MADTTLLLEHITMAGTVMAEHYGPRSSIEGGALALRVLASFVLGLHPDLDETGFDEHDELIESLTEVINGEISHAEFLARLPAPGQLPG
jgi:hypothetical protein